jgi:PAS domain S-box-containing protein
MNLESLVLESIGDPVIAIDREARVLVWTPSAERLLGYTAADVLHQVLPEIGIRLDTLLAGRERRLTLRRRDGAGFPATVTATTMLDADGALGGVVMVVKDLTPWIGPAGEEGTSSETLAVEERLGAAFRGIVEATGSDLERGGRLQPLAYSLVEQGRRLLPGLSCLIAVVPVARQDMLYCLAGSGPVAENLLNQSFLRQGTVLGMALADNQIVERTDMQDVDPFRDLFVAAGVNTMRVVPMGTQEPLPDGRSSLGAIAYYRADPRPFAPAERRLLDDFGALAGLQLQRAEFRAAAERSMTRLQLAVDVALDLARSLDVVEVVRRLVRRAAVATGAERGALLQLEGGENGEAVLMDAYDASGLETGVGFRMPVESIPSIQQAITSRMPVFGGVVDLEGFPVGLRQALGDVRYTATVPLVHVGDVIAVLVLSRRRDPPFSTEDVDTLTLLGGPAALALRNSNLYARTEEASRVKTDFLDMAAHELRTPLTVISGYLSILREGAFGPPPPRWDRPLRILDVKAAELRRLVDDLLLAARLETGRLESALAPVDLREVAEQCVQNADDVPELALPEEPVLVRADREQLTRLIDHVVANALAYIREGELPWARVEVEAGPDQGSARMTVEDRGRGLPPDERERVFERFSRYEDQEHPMVPGTGLGLYIARELAARHGGRLELEWTEPGAGSRFTLYLPLAA